MKKVKKWIGITLTVLMSLLAGCGQGDFNTDTNSSEQYVHFWPVFGCYEEKGVLYEEDGILYFVDYSSGREDVLCSRPNCTHRPYSASNPDPYCEAAAPIEAIHVTLLDGNTLYFFGTDFYTTEIYSKEVYGESWKKIQEIPYGYISYSLQQWIRDGKWYGVFWDAVPDESETAISVEGAAFLMEVDLENNSYRMLTEPGGENVSYFMQGLDGENLYYYVDTVSEETGEERLDLYVLNLTTLERSYVFEENAEHRYQGARDGDVYAIGNNGLWVWNAGGKGTCLYEDTESEYLNVAVWEEGIFVFNGSCMWYCNLQGHEWEEQPVLSDMGVLLGTVADKLVFALDDGYIGVIDIRDYLSGKAEYVVTFKPY